MDEKEKLELKKEIFNDLIDYNSCKNEDLVNIKNCIATIKLGIDAIVNILSSTKNYLDSNINYADYANDYLCNKITDFNIEIEKLKDKENETDIRN